MNGSLFPVVHLNDHTGKVFTLSYEVADFFGKRHDNITRLIREILEENQNFAPQFRGAKYSDRGKEYPCFRISEEGFGFLITKFTGSQFDQIKMAYVEQFTAMRHALPSRQHSRIEAREMCSSLEEQRALIGKETEPHHYMNEHGLCDRILLDCPKKKYLIEQGKPADSDLTDILNAEQIDKLDAIRTENHELIESGMDYKERKETLAKRYHREIWENQGVYMISP